MRQANDDNQEKLSSDHPPKVNWISHFRQWYLRECPTFIFPLEAHHALAREAANRETKIAWSSMKMNGYWIISQETVQVSTQSTWNALWNWNKQYNYDWWLNINRMQILIKDLDVSTYIHQLIENLKKWTAHNEMQNGKFKSGVLWWYANLQSVVILCEEHRQRFGLRENDLEQKKTQR